MARLLNRRQDEQEFLRVRRLGHLFEQFQLKYTVTSGVNGRHCLVNGKLVTNFGSSNYLGLEQHPEVVYAAKRAIDELGTESGFSPLLSSNDNLIDLEESLSQLLRAEATWVSHSAAQLHTAIIPALFSDPECVLFVDKSANAAMKNAVELAQGARLIRVDVSDPPALRRLLAKEKAGRGALLVDGVYGAHGHLPDLAMLDELCRDSGIMLYVDDSHGVGVFGEHGGGAAEACGLRFGNLLVVGSLQHAFGSYGGFVSGKSALVDFLRSTCVIAEGSLQPAAVEGALAAVRISRSPEGRHLRSRVAAKSRFLREKLTDLGYIVPPGDSPVIPVTIGKDLKTLMAGRKLYELGIFLQTVCYPKVAHNRGVLRISVSALHTEGDLEKLVAAFRDLRAYLPIHEHPLRQAAHLALEVGKAKWQSLKLALPR